MVIRQEIGSVNTMQHEKHFLETSYTKCGGETIPRPCPLQIKIEHIIGSTVSSFIYALLYAQLRAIEIY